MSKKVSISICLAMVAIFAVMFLSFNTVIFSKAAAKPEIPNKDNYKLENTVLSGDFESFNDGKEFGTSSAATDFWGTNIAYDYPAKIVNQEENKVLKMSKGEGNKPYASAFVFFSNEFSNGDFMTLEFEYKLDFADFTLYTQEKLTAQKKTSDCSFAPPTGEAHHIILLNGTKPTVTSGANTFFWDISYSDAANGEGWTKVSLTIAVNPGTLQANSIRWLMPMMEGAPSTDAMFIDNVKILRWIDLNQKDLRPEIVSGETNTFNKKASSDIKLVINTKGEEINNIKRGSTNVNATAFTKTADGDNVSIVLKKEYLSTLEEGTHNFTANTVEGSVTFTIIVESKKVNGCGGIVLGSDGGFTSKMLIVSAFLLTLTSLTLVAWKSLKKKVRSL